MSHSTRSRKDFLKVKAFRLQYKTYIFRENKQNFVFTAQFPSRRDQTSRSNRNIGKNLQDCLEKRRGIPVNMSHSTRSGKDLKKLKAFRT